jgi:uncharacterized protein
MEFTFEITLLIVAILFQMVGFIGSVVPILPGPILVFVGSLIYAWPTGFDKVGIWIILLLLVITILVQVLDFLMGAWGAKKFGGTWRGIVGAIAGALISIFSGHIYMIIILPLIGAVVGELIGGMQLKDSSRVGMGTLVGMILGMALRMGAAIVMIGIFWFAYIYR